LWIDVASYVTREVIQRRLRALAVDTIRLTASSIRTARVGRGAGRANPQSAIRNPQCS
jgi:hypothetical protein